jgi:hypothetical protein
MANGIAREMLHLRLVHVESLNAADAAAEKSLLTLAILIVESSTVAIFKTYRQPFQHRQQVEAADVDVPLVQRLQEHVWPIGQLRTRLPLELSEPWIPVQREFGKSGC